MPNRMNGSDGSKNENRRAQAICAVLSIALTFIFIAYLFRNLSSVEDFDLGTVLLYGGVAIAISLFFMTRDQIAGRVKAEAALAASIDERNDLKAAFSKLQEEAKNLGDTDVMIARAVALQEQLRNSEALHQSLVHTLPFFIFRKDVEGRFVFVNDRFCKHFGLKREEILG